MASTHNHIHQPGAATPDGGLPLTTRDTAILARGLGTLVQWTEGLSFRAVVSERYPLPLVRAFRGCVPEPAEVRDAVVARAGEDPVSVLEAGLVLLELYACNRAGVGECIPDDAAFLGETFGTKRNNGWAAILGNGDRAELTSLLNGQWQFRFMEEMDPVLEIYALLNRLARYGFVYGRMVPGDGHAMGHFIEEFGPGILFCRGVLDDLSLTLALAAMKMGVPAVVPDGFPFPLGRQVRSRSLADVLAAPKAFANIRRLPDLPELPALLDCLLPEHAKEEVEPAVIWGETEDSFFLLRKGRVTETGVVVKGEPAGPMGVILTVDAEPLDAFDRRYMESHAAGILSRLRGVTAQIQQGRLLLGLAGGIDLDPELIGKALIAALRRDFPKIGHVRAEVIFDRDRLADEVGEIRGEREQRTAEIESATEESVDGFVTCTGCSPFAPEHVCIVTPERAPQCARPYEKLKTGALYGYDDMSNIHHRSLHADMNSFGICAKGEAIDRVGGEWSGVNRVVSELTGGRITRVRLHSLDAFPHTGCSCFRLIMFKLNDPHKGIGVMDRAYEGRAPDGRTWADLHYALTGKQTPGMAGASPAYLFSPKFLSGHDGWESVTWVSPEIAAIMGDRFPEGVAIGDPPA